MGAIAPSRSLPHIQLHTSEVGCPDLVNTKAPPLTTYYVSETKKHGPKNMKEQNKTPEKELSDKGIANLSDAEFKTLVIRMLTGMSMAKK